MDNHFNFAKNQLIRFSDLESILNNGKKISRDTIDRWIENEGFPHKIKLGPNSVAWNFGEVITWVSAREKVKNIESNYKNRK